MWLRDISDDPRGNQALRYRKDLTLVRICKYIFSGDRSNRCCRTTPSAAPAFKHCSRWLFSNDCQMISLCFLYFAGEIAMQLLHHVTLILIHLGPCKKFQECKFLDFK